MKGIYLVVTLSVTTLTIAVNESSLENKISICTETNQVDNTIYFPHETDCTKFYTCFMGKKIEMDCPFIYKEKRRLHFNAVFQLCDWPHRANCKNYQFAATEIPVIIPTEIISTTTSTPKNCPKDTNGTIIKSPHESTCNYYYACIDGEITVEKCRRGMLFNPKLLVCDLPENVDCDKTSTSTSTTTPSPTPKHCINGTLRNHESNCSYYYECVDKDWVLRYCPNGEHFNNVTKFCMDPKDANCENTTTTTSITTTISTTTTTTIITTTTTTTTTPNLPPKHCINGSLHNHECNCSYYYICVDKEWVLNYCPRGENFNNVTKTCMDPKDAHCKNSSDLGIPTVNPEVSCDDGSLSPHQCECPLFYQCVKGNYRLRYCASGLHFNRADKTCDIPSIAKCENCSSSKFGTVPYECTTTPIPATTLDQCFEKFNGTRIPHEYDCRFFYICESGHKVVKKCRKNWHFNSKYGICDFPENVNCSTLSTTDSPNLAASKCSTEGIYKIRHETDCSLYYTCVNGEENLKKCPRNLRFNPSLKVCDSPENVPCTQWDE